jgi:D-sedoheptulose 7-phosphate isomerase
LSYIEEFFQESKRIIDSIDTTEVEKMVELIDGVRSGGGRLFFLGVGGGAGHCGHAVNDFRKIAGIEAYAPTDNVSELTARTNDDGWETSFVNWLRVSRLGSKDGIFVFSVGGGDAERNISANIVSSLKLARKVGAKIMGVVGRDGGYTAKVADACVVIPPLNKETITPQVEGFQAVVWHAIVSHPNLVRNAMKWESVEQLES